MQGVFASATTIARDRPVLAACSLFLVVIGLKAANLAMTLRKVEMVDPDSQLHHAYFPTMATGPSRIDTKSRDTVGGWHGWAAQHLIPP